MPNLVLSISGVSDEDVLQEDTFRLVADLNEDFDARTVAGSTAPGERAGSAALTGEIALAIISSGAAVAFLDVIKGYFSRRRGAEITVSRADGATLSIKTEQLNKEEYQATLAKAEAFLEGA